MSFIDESGYSLLLRKSCNNHFHTSCKLITCVLEIIRQCGIHLHCCLDSRIIFSTTNYICESQCIFMNTELFIRTIEKFFSKYSRKIIDCFSLVIDQCCHMNSSLKLNFISKITNFLSAIYHNRLTTKNNRISHKKRILLSAICIARLNPRLKLGTSNT